MRKTHLFLIAGLIIVAGSFQSVSAQPPFRLMDLSNGYGVTDSNMIPMDFDKETCEQDCRSRFGVDLYAGWGFGSSNPGYYAYAQCIQECNQRFWRSFDERIRNLEDQ